jgi:hypothetical protein
MGTPALIIPTAARKYGDDGFVPVRESANTTPL